jgi:hypothetical protein
MSHKFKYTTHKISAKCHEMPQIVSSAAISGRDKQKTNFVFLIRTGTGRFVQENVHI